MEEEKKVVGYNGSGSETYGRKARTKKLRLELRNNGTRQSSAKIPRGKKA